MRLGPRRDAPVFSVMKDRDFRAIWYVGSLRELSRRMELLVLSWLILQATQSPFQLGLVLVFNNLPRPALSLFTGFIADRFDRWRILMASQNYQYPRRRRPAGADSRGRHRGLARILGGISAGRHQGPGRPVPAYRNPRHSWRAATGKRSFPGQHQQYCRQNGRAAAGRHND